MGDMLDLHLEQFDYPDMDGIGELTICPQCGNPDMFVGTDFSRYCDKCGYID